MSRKSNTVHWFSWIWKIVKIRRNSDTGGHTSHCSSFFRFFVTQLVKWLFLLVNGFMFSLQNIIEEGQTVDVFHACASLCLVQHTFCIATCVAKK